MGWGATNRKRFREELGLEQVFVGQSRKEFQTGKTEHGKSSKVQGGEGRVWPAGRV